MLCCCCCCDLVVGFSFCYRSAVVLLLLFSCELVGLLLLLFEVMSRVVLFLLFEVTSCVVWSCCGVVELLLL